MAPRSKKTAIDEKIWTQHLILKQSPLWITAVALVMTTGILRRWNDADYLIFSTAVASPAVLLPALLCPGGPKLQQHPWWNSYWFKLNIWVAIVVCFGTYFGTAYFFDLMGMRYAFDVRWGFSSDVVGQSRQQVPVFMYPLTHAYFMSYFTGLLVAERGILRLLRLGSSPGFVARGLVVIVLAYGLAFIETYLMASPLLADLFSYQRRDRMLSIGSMGYAAYFVVGLPMVRRIDSRNRNWTLDRVVIEALATCMAILVLLEAWAKLMGPL